MFQTKNVLFMHHELALVIYKVLRLKQQGKYRVFVMMFSLNRLNTKVGKSSGSSFFQRLLNVRILI